MAVNITNLTNINSMYDLGLYASKSSTGLFWGLILLSLFIVIVTRLRNMGMPRAVTSASFACFMIALLLFSINFLDLVWVIVFVLMVAGSVMFIYITEKNQYTS